MKSVVRVERRIVDGDDPRKRGSAPAFERVHERQELSRVRYVGAGGFENARVPRSVAQTACQRVPVTDAPSCAA